MAYRRRGGELLWYYGCSFMLSNLFDVTKSNQPSTVKTRWAKGVLLLEEISLFPLMKCKTSDV